jgi:hypothetical protein
MYTDGCECSIALHSSVSDLPWEGIMKRNWVITLCMSMVANVVFLLVMTYQSAIVEQQRVVLHELIQDYTTCVADLSKK